MTLTHNLGFPCAGATRELTSALERYWNNEASVEELEVVTAQLRQRHWQQQAQLDFAPVGDFSLCDPVLDMSFMLGNIPQRACLPGGSALDTYLQIACGVHASETAAWFDTNADYIVPEFSAGTRFALDAGRLAQQLAQARALGVKAKPVILGPLTYLWLGKAQDGVDRLALLAQLLPVYAELLAWLAGEDIAWVQIDEPALVTELDPHWRDAYVAAYDALHGALHGSGTKLLLATYFGALKDNLPLACALPVDGLHLDAIQARTEIGQVIAALGQDKVLSLGVIDGRSAWKTDLHATLAWLEPVHRQIGERLWIAPSCSLRHVPADLHGEQALDSQMRSSVASAPQKLDELRILATALDHGRSRVQEVLVENAAAIDRCLAPPRTSALAARGTFADIKLTMREHVQAHTIEPSKTASPSSLL